MSIVTPGYGFSVCSGPETLIGSVVDGFGEEMNAAVA
jgi:hypothetical protein